MKIIIVPPIYNWLFSSEGTDRWLCFTKINNILKEKNNGSKLSIISKESNLNEADWIIFMGWHSWSYKWYNKIVNENLENKAVYWLLEPPVVENKHNKEAIDKLLKRFKYVLTWNPKLFYLDRVFFLPILYNWQDDINLTLFSDKKSVKLLTNISGNKTSEVVGELYSERKKIIDWFDKNHPDEFEFYGFGWNREKYRTYFGTCKDKKVVYTKFKFALALENVSMENCLSEKILDCFTAGIVPIYKGATNIDKFIPESCYIDYNKFDTVNEMYEYLKNMDDKTYKGYIISIKEFLANTSDIPLLSAREWIRCIENLKEEDTKALNFKVNKDERDKFLKEMRVYILKQNIGRIKSFIYNILVFLRLIRKHD